MSVRFRIASGEQGRADRALARRYPELGRRTLARLFLAGHVRVNDQVARKGTSVAPGDEVSVAIDPDQATAVVAADEPGVRTLYVDDTLVAIAKPAGMPSHPLAAGERGTAANVVIARFPECASASPDPREGGLVHRLDTFTSGVLVAARTHQAWTALRDQFDAHTIHKRYLALVSGDIDDQGECRARLSGRGKRVRVDAGGSAARTSWRLVARCGQLALVECATEYGRRHQVRVHLAHAGHPIAGDAPYGGVALPGLDGQFLHASELLLVHPTSGDTLRLVAPLPLARLELLESLGFERREIGVDQQEQ